jgi:hypothetical protein
MKNIYRQFDKVQFLKHKILSNSLVKKLNKGFKEF